MIKTVPSNVKVTSVLRRAPDFGGADYASVPGFEGDVCVFELAGTGQSIVVESANGRMLMLAAGDLFLGSPGHRESTRWVVGGVPPGGLQPGSLYWVLAEAGIVGCLEGDSPRKKAHLGQALYHGAVVHRDGQTRNITQFAEPVCGSDSDRGAPVYLLLGTSAEVGKTTAGIAICKALRQQGAKTVVALKATGTASSGELFAYLDLGVEHAFDCVDFGLPTTYPSGRAHIDHLFDRALGTVLSMQADAIVIECGGDVLGANVPIFLKCLLARRAALHVVLAASDALGAYGGMLILRDMGITLTAITGLCTDTPTLRQRTEDLCQVTAVNMSGQSLPYDISITR